MFLLEKVFIKNRIIILMTIKLEDSDIDHILIDEKSHKNVLIYEISFKTLIGPKPLCVRFDKIDGFTRIYDETRYLTLFGSEKYNGIYNRIRCLISLKSGITYFYFKNNIFYFTKHVLKSTYFIVSCTYVFLTIMQKSNLILMILYL